MQREFYKSIKAMVDDSYKKYEGLLSEYNKLKEERQSGAYSRVYLDSMIIPKMQQLFSDMSSVQRELNERVKVLCESKKEEIRKEDCLNPLELTEDAKLLNGNFSLKARDIEEIINRNKGNRTMTQLAIRYAQEHYIEGLEGVVYLSAESQCAEYDGVIGAVDTVSRWMENPDGYRKMYDRIISEDGILGSTIED